ncbi:MAG TPA: hypothetical protein VED85_05975 [Burkholderiaceae bacterium]|nr:hypothetical protein [Burkholderiaceae bacterium]
MVLPPFRSRAVHKLPVHRIELRLRELSQLFNSLDPTPFHEKDLDPDAEQFIESWALEFAPESRLQIIVHLERVPADVDTEALVSTAIRNFFAYKAELKRRELRLLLREGRTSLAVGLSFLAACLLAANLVSNFIVGPYLQIAREGLTIGGWVAMWQPLQIFLYEWWPLVRRRHVYHNLATAQVRVVPSRGGAHVQAPEAAEAIAQASEGQR